MNHVLHDGGPDRGEELIVVDHHPDAKDTDALISVLKDAAHTVSLLVVQLIHDFAFPRHLQNRHVVLYLRLNRPRAFLLEEYQNGCSGQDTLVCAFASSLQTD